MDFFAINGIDPILYYKPTPDLTIFSRVCGLCPHRFVFRFNWSNNIDVINALHTVWLAEVLEHLRGHVK